ncbi:hypothetical protein EPO34_00530 [Patescibacteria group bacterium]|nr:MAG: hypothetical protein EPO34_00530 [Patescibacteria group bacterium]
MEPDYKGQLSLLTGDADPTAAIQAARTALDRLCKGFMSSELRDGMLLRAAEEARQQLVAVRSAGAYCDLAALIAPYARQILEVEEDLHLQEYVVLRLPADLFVQAFLHGKDVREKWELAFLIAGAERVRDLIKDLWAAGNLDDAALLYASAYSEGRREDALSNSRETACDDVPKDFLRALMGYDRWPDPKAVAGIDEWIAEEIDPK